MKATELRIGNYVNSRRYNTVKVDAIMFDVLFMEGIDEPESLIDISPIPLTEEWLVKLGFESEGNMWYTTNNISYNTEDNRVVREQPGILGTIYNAITRVSYVHQLQNLYFVLTGKELC